ncbi:M15 family metallopeptidase [Actinoallomurus soli]|uniref:M15 family metallopeptidase n=1 Tax=Actinoallomurus soli TaxID=2952535 RepID=UPI00209321AA|nr:M15 family metallopeptidase [Actinoallomurus soli]MCO5971620.1 dipeptidase [Actinoallomurus soli]
MILLSDPRVLRVPVVECGEPLAEVGTVPRLLLDPRERDAEGAYGRVRMGVLHRLRSAAADLPGGVRLLIIEGHRATGEQARRFSLYEERLRSQGISDPVELRRQASAFVSPVDVAPHCAGAAVDLTLVGVDGRELDMGGPVNGHRSGQEHTCPINAPVSPAARTNRDLLADTMTAAGFVNYPTEWWHWSFGDRYWALLTGAKNAVYGPV